MGHVGVAWGGSKLKLKNNNSQGFKNSQMDIRGCV